MRFLINSLRTVLNVILPKNKLGDKIYSFFNFIVNHRGRFPRNRMLFNDYMYKLKISDEISNPLRVFITDKEFAKILKLLKEFTENNGASFYFVYIPEYNRYKNKLSITDDSQNYKEVIQIIKDLEIPFIDLNEELFQKHKDLLSLYPFRSRGHFNELGYKTLAEIIFKKFYKN